MKTDFVTLGRFLAGAITIATVSTQAQMGAFQTKVFEDNFDGTTRDHNKWVDYDLGSRNDCINSKAASCLDGNGNLVIKTYTTSGAHYTGMLRTKCVWKYGYFEARIKFENPLGGMWSAFWVQSPALGNPIGDPAAAGCEFDIVEYRQSDKSNADISQTAVSNLHWDGYGASHKKEGSGLWPGVSNLNDGHYHVFGMYWDSTGEKFFCDGKQVHAVTSPVSQTGEFIVLSSEVRDNNWAGKIPSGGFGSASETTCKMVVDYVRVWQ